MKDSEGKLLIDGAVIAGVYFLVIRPLVNMFGGNPADQAAIDNIKQLPDAQNPFSPNFGIAYCQANNMSLDYVLASQAFIKSGYNDPANMGTDGVHAAIPYFTLAENVYRSMGFFWVDQATVEASFNAVLYQYEVCQMAIYLLAKYNVDLFTWIQKGQSLTSLIDNGIQKDALAAIITHIQTLPVFGDLPTGNGMSQVL